MVVGARCVRPAWAWGRVSGHARAIGEVSALARASARARCLRHETAEGSSTCETASGRVHPTRASRQQRASALACHRRCKRAPARISALAGERVLELAAGGDHSAASTATGKVFSWGWAAQGQLGRPSDKTAPRSIPGLVQALSGAQVRLAPRTCKHATRAGPLGG